MSLGKSELSEKQRLNESMKPLVNTNCINTSTCKVMLRQVRTLTFACLNQVNIFLFYENGSLCALSELNLS